jgi:hypothetical protein
MLERNHSFKGIEVVEYEDWGTLEEWRKYTDSFATLFVDVDGVIVINENPLGKSSDWSSFRPITPNVEYLLELSKEGRKQIVFTTSRSEKHREILNKCLNDAGFISFSLLMGLSHAKRYLVNDFAPTNRYPTAISINLPRNDENLSNYFPF